MIEFPQNPPPAYEQVLTRNLVECGLRGGGFTVQYQEELQSVEIVIGADAGASADRFDCIRQAAGHDIVTIRNPALQQAYENRVLEVMRPGMLAEARAELARRGVLTGFPERSQYRSDKLFAEAIERQCAVTPGSVLVQRAGGLILQPGPGQPNKAARERLSCVLTALGFVVAKGEDLKVGIIGNEAMPADKSGHGSDEPEGIDDGKERP